MLNALVSLFCFKIKKSAICIAIIGANTEPIKYRKSVISANGRKTAPAVPITVTKKVVNESTGLKLGLKEGDIYTAEDLIRAVLI